MVFGNAQDIFAQSLQEERLAKLCDDNAFVNVAEVFKRQRRDGAPVNAVDIEVNFLEPSADFSSAPPRVHLSRCLMEQHRAYTRALEEDRRDHKKEDGASAAGPSSSSSSSSYSSSEDGDTDTTTNRVKRPRDFERRSRGRKKQARGELQDVSVHANKISVNLVQTVSDVGRERRNLGGWLQSRRSVPLELTVPGPSYMAMAAPPPLHVGGYHLCSVCLLPASYKCVRCRGALFCSIKCHVTHDATRCMKFIV
ncbi:hypothetical protein MOQ_000482 [Trypanosoma cruzi marinkellei]|uniref:HIT-type domain-containing protein n=1 Tax=Trypanosoma cruzi marinkellei TaxID=85056 RepID=K2PEB3_TRYCR|nr:hypothetical protein MOQ_000482 [Trypanosoma cruzi marinkellei]